MQQTRTSLTTTTTFCSLFLFMSVLLLQVATKPVRAAAWLGSHHHSSSLFRRTSRTTTTAVFRMSSSSSSNNDDSSSKKKTKTIHNLLKGKRLVSVEECLQVHGEPGVQFLDGSWFLKDRNGREEYEKGPRIAGAHYLDIDDVAAKGPVLNPKGLPHMMPPPQLFASVMDTMQITNDDHLIVYATQGCMMVHRALFQIQSFGHDRDRIHLMDGSLAEWEEAGGKIDTEPIKAISADDAAAASDDDTTTTTYSYKATKPQQVVDIDEIRNIIKAGDDGDIIVDVRASNRFYGEVDEPGPGLRLGHMPGAKNLFFYSLLDESNVSKFKSPTEMKELIKNAGIDLDTPDRIVISCGSGATACTLAAALDICGRDPTKTYVYDGSWVEWGGEQDTPITKEK